MYFHSEVLEGKKIKWGSGSGNQAAGKQEARLWTEYLFIHFDFQTMGISHLFKNVNKKEQTHTKITNKENKNNNQKSFLIMRRHYNASQGENEIWRKRPVSHPASTIY